MTLHKPDTGPPVDAGGVPLLTDPNILMFIADDASTVEFAAYNEDPNKIWAHTPTIDHLAATGVLFKKSYAKPICSPTRAALHTGRYGFRTGVGTLTNEEERPLNPDEILIPQMIDEGTDGLYATALIGKLHMSSRATRGSFETFACDGGYDYFAGSMANLERRRGNYRSWARTVARKTPNGCVFETKESHEYAPTQNVNDALEWIGEQTKPWFCMVNWNVPHAPYEAPPPALYDTDRWTFNSPSDGTSVDKYRAMLQAMDSEMGRLLAGLPGYVRSNTHVIFWADNGTPQPVVQEPPFRAVHGKRTVYEQGVRVPLIWAGPGIDSPHRETDILVQAEDFFVTFADVLDVNLTTLYPGRTYDGVTFAPHLFNKSATGLRNYVYTETWSPNIPNADAAYSGPRMIRDLQYKFIRDIDQTGTVFPSIGDEMYDLDADPLEVANLIPGGATGTLTAAQLQAYNELTTELTTIVNS